MEINGRHPTDLLGQRSLVGKRVLCDGVRCPLAVGFELRRQNIFTHIYFDEGEEKKSTEERKLDEKEESNSSKAVTDWKTKMKQN